MSEFIVDPEDWPIEEIIKDQVYFDAAIRYAEEQGYSDLADAVHGLKARLKLSKVKNDVLTRRGAELERHTELLRAVAEAAYPLGSPTRNLGWLPAATKEMFMLLQLRIQEAIDGGVLDKDGGK